MFKQLTLTAFAVGLLSAPSAFSANCPYPEKGKNFISDEGRKECLKEAVLLLEQPLSVQSDDSAEVLNALLAGPDFDELHKNAGAGFDRDEIIRCQFIAPIDKVQSSNGDYVEQGADQNGLPNYQYKAADYGGVSQKFYCLRADVETGELYPEDSDKGKATAISGAVKADKENNLLDEDGNLAVVVKTNPDTGAVSEDTFEGDEIKVKFFDMSAKNGVPVRHREVMTEAFATRLAWALGIPADRFYAVGGVVCDGCDETPYVAKWANPNKKKFALKAQTQQAKNADGSLKQANFGSLKHHDNQKEEAAANQTGFKFHVGIERKYDGKRLEPLSIDMINVKAKKNPRGRLGAEKAGWSFYEVAQPSSSAQQKLEAQVLALFAAVVGYENDNPIQNRLVCAKNVVVEGQKVKGKNKESGKCDHAVAIIQDLGSTFGKKIGIGLAKMKNGGSPRGNIALFAKNQTVWAPGGSCTLAHSLIPKKKVSESPNFVNIGAEAITVFSDRIRKIKPHIRAMLKDSRFELIDTEYVSQIRKKQKKSLEDAYDVVLDEWTKLITSRIAQIETANCPN